MSSVYWAIIVWWFTASITSWYIPIYEHIKTPEIKTINTSPVTFTALYMCVFAVLSAVRGEGARDPSGCGEIWRPGSETRDWGPEGEARWWSWVSRLLFHGLVPWYAGLLLSQLHDQHHPQLRTGKKEHPYSEWVFELCAIIIESDPVSVSIISDRKCLRLCICIGVGWVDTIVVVWHKKPFTKLVGNLGTKKACAYY